jgi:glycosyltransferase involved in cell wall biosynthesis
MNILNVYSGNLYGGVETFLATLARCPALGAGHRQTFALCFEGRLSRELAAEGAALEWLGPVQVRKPWTLWRARARLGALLRGRPDFEVVVCHSPWSQALFGPVARAHGRPLVFYLHGPVEGRHWTDRWAARTPPDLMIGVSRHTLASGRALFPQVRAAVLNYPMPWPEDRFTREDRDATRAELGATPETAVIIQVSRMDAWKGHTDHLEALGRLRDLPGWTCWMVGGAQRPREARYEAGLKRQAGRLGIAERVRFLGERRDVPRLLSAADLFCQANTGPEGFSLAFMEAFAAGLPIVTTALGGAPELIDASCGWLTPPGDIAALAEALRRLIVDPQERRALGAAARRRVRALCDPATQIGQLVDWLAALAPKARSTAVGHEVSA